MLIGVYTDVAELKVQAQALAYQLNLPLLQDSSGSDYLLAVTPSRLELRQTPRAGQTTPGSVYIPWTDKRYYQRSRNARQEMIGRAVGVKNKPFVIDATAGLGRDAYLLAVLGCRVLMLERSPIIHALLQEALTKISPTLQDRLRLTAIDSCRYLTVTDPADVVYLDPMYPERQKSAAVKKEAKLLRAIVGADDDAHALLHCGLQAAKSRVVVKRPRLAPYLADKKPTYTLSGRSTRFDIYII